jgi:hypothetical protein
VFGCYSAASTITLKKNLNPPAPTNFRPARMNIMNGATGTFFFRPQGLKRLKRERMNAYKKKSRTLEDMNCAIYDRRNFIQAGKKIFKSDIYSLFINQDFMYN